MKTILVAADGSDGSDRAIVFGATLVKAFDARLVIANVKGGHGLPGELFRRFTAEQSAFLEEALAAQSASVLEKARNRAREQGVTAVRLDSLGGDVCQAIMECADEANADAIVVGKRGTGRIAGVLLGSVSQKLVSLATRVVIVVP